MSLDLTQNQIFYKIDTIVLFEILDNRYEEKKSPIVTVGIETINRKIKLYARPVSSLKEEPDLVFNISIEEISIEDNEFGYYINTDFFSSKKKIEKWYVYYSVYGDNQLEYIRFTEAPLGLDDKREYWLTTETGKERLAHRALPKKQN